MRTLSGLIAALCFVQGILYSQPSGAFRCQELFIPIERVDIDARLKSLLYVDGKMVSASSQSFVDSLNQTFGLDSAKTLAFAWPEQSDLNGRNHPVPDDVKTLTYHQGFARGVVYISSAHDIHSHVRGFLKIAETQEWASVREMLAGLLSLESEGGPDAHEAKRIRIAITMHVENITAALTHRGGSDEHWLSVFAYHTAFARSQYDRLVSKPR